jgi:hypothetical protein
MRSNTENKERKVQYNPLVYRDDVLLTIVIHGLSCKILPFIKEN